MIDPASVGGLAEIGDWIRTGGTLGVLVVLLGFWLRKKKEDREGWGQLIIALQGDVKTSRDECATLRAQHANCEARLTEVEAQLRGVHAQLVMHSSNTAVPLGTASRNVAEAAVRAAEIVRNPPKKSP